MRYKLIEQTGFESAMLGAMLSFGKTSFETFEKQANGEQMSLDLVSRLDELSIRLVKGGRGHDKFLEQIQYWIVLQAPLCFWKQFDTYRVGISKSSESTMHKSWKNGIRQENFEYPVYPETLFRLNKNIEEYMDEKTEPERKSQLFEIIVGNLPDGYLQTRLVNINAKSLRNIWLQRKDHKLKEWRDFCEWLKTLPHGDLITYE